MPSERSSERCPRCGCIGPADRPSVWCTAWICLACSRDENRRLVLGIPRVPPDLWYDPSSAGEGGRS